MMPKIKIALVPSSALGDGLIFLILAHNLAKNGFAVTFYSKPFLQMAAWLSEISVRANPALADCDTEFAAYDLVFADSTSILAKPHWAVDAFPALARKYIYLGLGRVEPELRCDHTERLRAQLSPELFERCRHFADSSGEIRFRSGDRTVTMVEEAVGFCRDVWDLQNVDKATGMVPPAALNLQHRRFAKRILLHPFSSLGKHSWPLPKFLKLARKLRQDGWDPEFCSGASERAQLLAVIGTEFPAPEFDTLADFAAYIYESAVLIGNDSGPVHLASSLDVPTLSISSRGKNHRWRPGWSGSKVTLSLMKLKFGHRTIWTPFLPVWLVYRDFKQLVAAE